MVAGLFSTGCTTVRSLPAADLAEPGWQIRQGQALWRGRTGAVELAGEFLVAVGPGGAWFVQFSKVPMTVTQAQGDGRVWQVEYPAVRRTLRGHGAYPAGFAWPQFASWVAGRTPGNGWQLTTPDAQSFRLESRVSGEHIEGVFAP